MQAKFWKIKCQNFDTHFISVQNKSKPKEQELQAKFQKINKCSPTYLIFHFTVLSKLKEFHNNLFLSLQNSHFTYNYPQVHNCWLNIKRCASLRWVWDEKIKTKIDLARVLQV